MIQLYKAFIPPRLMYCGPILIGITKSLSNKVEDANNYIIRTLLGLPKSTSYDSILRLINMRTQEQRRFFNVLKGSVGMVLVTLKISFIFVQSTVIIEAQALRLSKILLLASGALIPLHP